MLFHVLEEAIPLVFGPSAKLNITFLLLNFTGEDQRYIYFLSEAISRLRGSERLDRFKGFCFFDNSFLVLPTSALGVRIVRFSVVF